jgi:hypothetical protein
MPDSGFGGLPANDVKPNINSSAETALKAARIVILMRVMIKLPAGLAA